MTTLAADKIRPIEGGNRNEIPVIAADIVYQHAAAGVARGDLERGEIAIFQIGIAVGRRTGRQPGPGRVRLRQPPLDVRAR